MSKRMMDVLNRLVPDDPTPGLMLRAFRKREQLRLKDMEFITGIKESNLSAIENGHIAMTQHYAEIFAAALAVHPSAFLYPDGKFAKDSNLLAIERRAKKMRRKD